LRRRIGGGLKVVDVSDKFSLEQYRSNPHSGTHVDSPAYLFPDGKKIEEFGLERFMTDAALLDLTHKKPGQPIDDEDLEAAEEAAGLALREGESVILYTVPGVSPSNVYLSRNGAEYLEFKRVGLVGIDAGSIDNSRYAEMAAHRALLAKGILVLEGLRNLDSIDSSRFRLASFPLKLGAATAPVRAVAILE
jgi:arylformamidase